MKNKLMKLSKGRITFMVINVMLIVILTILCIIPVWTMFCYSVSSASAVNSDQVAFWPVDLTSAAYKYVMINIRFWDSMKVSMLRILIGVPLSMILIILSAYPLSKSEDVFKARKYYVWFFIVTMLFSGGMIPTYIVISKLKLVNTIWSLVLPGAVSVFNIILMMNFFKAIPGEIEEAALVDGANQWTIMLKVILPLAKPAIATVGLFVILFHWNSWFDGILYMNTQSKYPLQSYLQSINTDTTQLLMQGGNVQDLMDKMKLSEDNLRAAQIFISMIPIMCVYPWLQKYFTSGIVMGSVKG